MRTIAGMRNNILCLLNIETLFKYKMYFGLKQATLMPESETSLERDRMFRNHKELANFGKVEISLMN
jgi:hypothetical protein